MTPGRTPASGFYYSDSCAGEGGSCMGDSDPFWGCDAEGENASASTCRWGGVSVVQPAALESPLSLYPPGHDSTPLSPTSLFSALPNSGAWAALPSADIGQLSGSETGAALPSADIGQLSGSETGAALPSADIGQLSGSETGAALPPGDIGQLSGSETGAALPPGDIHQLSVNKSAASPEPPQRLTRKRVREVEQTEAAPSAKKSADRMVQIADFTWTLPPDPGEGGPYPSLTFLTGAAISSSDSGMMTQAAIRQWIRARYPSKPASEENSIRCALSRRTDFVNIRSGKRGIRLWRLCDPQQFRSYYEKNMFLNRRSGISSRERAFRSSLPAPEQDSPGAASTVLTVEIGGYILTLPLYRTGREKPSLRLLCGCAIALGPEQGSSVKEIATWISGYYPVQEAKLMEGLKANIRSTLNLHSGDFRRTGIYTPRILKKGPRDTRWMLQNPADFVVRLSPMQSRRRVGTLASPAGVRQVPVSSEEGLSGTAPELTRKRPDKVEQAAVLPGAKEQVGSAVHIAGFTWTLPSDPGEGGPYPSLIFLAGAAISSSDSGMMTLTEICQWISKRYPSRLISALCISKMLTGRTDFTSIRASKQCWKSAWKLRNPEQFRSYYEKNIYLKRRCGIAYRNWALRTVPPAPGQKRSGAVSAQPGLSLSGQSVPTSTGDDMHAPELSVKIGGHILTLPAYSAGQIRAPLRLLCGCAIALGSEQGSGVGEITEWIAGRHFIRDKSAKKKLNYDVSRILCTFHKDFSRTEIRAPRVKKGRGGMCWVLKNPADFAASYGGSACSQNSSAPSLERDSRSFKEGAEL